MSAGDAAALTFTITARRAATLVGCSAAAEIWRGLVVCSERPRDGYDRSAFGTGYRKLKDDIIAALGRKSASRSDYHVRDGSAGG